MLGVIVFCVKSCGDAGGVVVGDDADEDECDDCASKLVNDELDEFREDEAEDVDEGRRGKLGHDREDGDTAPGAKVVEFSDGGFSDNAGSGGTCDGGRSFFLGCEPFGTELVNLRDFLGTASDFDELSPRGVVWPLLRILPFPCWFGSVESTE